MILSITLTPPLLVVAVASSSYESSPNYLALVFGIVVELRLVVVVIEVVSRISRSRRDSIGSSGSSRGIK